MKNKNNSIENSLNSPLNKPNFEEIRFKNHFMGIPTFILYSFLNLQCALSISAYTPIEKTLIRYYDMQTSTVVLSSTLFLIGNAISVFIVFPINKKWGLSNAIRIGVFFNLLGGALRLLINHSFSYVLIGQFFMGVSSCFVYNNQMEFNYNWFHPKKRPIYNSVLSLSVYIGGGLGNSMPLIFMNQSNIDSITEGHHAVYKYTFNMFIIIAVLSVITLIVFRGQPPIGFG